MIDKINRIAKRHNMSIVPGVLYELFIRLWTKQYIRRIIGIFLICKQPKRVDFVVGCYNSGTTVVKEAIAAHPLICSAPIEGDQLSDELADNEFGIAPRAMLANICEVVKDRNRNDVDYIKLISDLRPWIKKNKYFLEKSISNTVRIKRLRKSFPGAKYICVTRSVDNVVKGIKKRSRPEGMLREVLGQDTYPDGILIKQWKLFYSCVLKDYKPSDIYFVSYEKFLLTPVEELKKIFEFMGIEAIDLSISGDILSVGDKTLRIRGREKAKYITSLSTYSELVDAVKEIGSVA